eukprot:g14027.t1
MDSTESRWRRLCLNNLIRGQLQLRVAVSKYIKRHPDVLKVKIDRPVIIMGLPRTGSSLLQHLMSLDPHARHLCFWEMTMPTPPPTEANYTTDPRIAMVQQGLESISLISKDFMTQNRKFHNVNSSGMEEELLLLYHSIMFMSHYFLAGINSPFYEWFMAEDAPHHRSAYVYLKLALQLLLFHYSPKSFLVLKAPTHSLQPAALLDVFPNARIVNTHRDPASVVSSWTKFQRQMLCIYVDSERAVENTNIYAKLTLDMCEKMCNRVMKYREKPEAKGKWIDIQYKQLIANPMQELQKICDFHDLKFHKKWKQKVEEYLEEQEKKNTGKEGGISGEKRLSEFGLDPKEVEDAFKAYRERYLHC